jgi:hypothetical protein
LKEVAKGCLNIYNATTDKGIIFMAIVMKLSDDLAADAKVVAAAEHRSVPKQIEYWARIGKAVLENPELPLRMIQDTMLSIEEVKAGQVSAYKFG